MRWVEGLKCGNAYTAIPRTNRVAARRRVVSSSRDRGTPAARRLPSESVIATPTIQTKDGKTVSVSVQPCHSVAELRVGVAPAAVVVHYDHERHHGSAE